jgi:flagellar protein FlgJ
MEYVKKFQDLAIDSVRGTGIFPSVVLAQAVIESSDSKGQAGESKLAKFYNNHFGIKGGANWKGKSVSLLTTEYYGGQRLPTMQLFRMYTSTVNGFIDHAMLLYQNKRYWKAGLFDATTPEEQCDALQAGGYAGENPTYAGALKYMINSLNLKSIDALARKKALSVSQ